MNTEMRTWLDKELKEYSGLFAEFKRKLKKAAPLWMAVAVIAMVALGFVAGYDFAYILKVHFLIGCVIALIIGFCYWIMGKATSMKKVTKTYEKAVNEFFQAEEDQERFVKQMESGNYGTVNFLNTKSEQYPTRFMAGHDYWMFCRGVSCTFIRTADIESVQGETERTRVSYNVGGRRAGSNMTIGYSMVIKYKEDTSLAGAEKQKEQTLFFQSEGQFRQAEEVIKKYCPEYDSWKK